MSINLTEEQRKELAANPGQAVRVVDDSAGKVYYLVDEAFLQPAPELDETYLNRLRALIQEGIESDHVSREVGEARIREKIQHYADQASKCD